MEHRQIYPRPGWVEHDGRELLACVMRCLEAAGGAAAVGIANQGETVIAWDADSGEPVCNAIVWQDNRTQAATERLKAEGAEHMTLERAGLPLDPYFSASKLRWILDNVPAAARLAARGRLRLGTSDAFFLDRVCGIYATDVDHGLAHQPHEPRHRAVGRRVVPLVRRAHRVAPADPLDGG